MKKRIFSLMIGAVVALTSCSKSDEGPNLPQSGEQLATFNIEVPATRATVAGLSRYIVEAYEGKDLTTSPLRVEAATGSLTLALKKNTEYTFVFWADKGTAKTESVASSGYYNTDNLQEVVVTAGKKNTVGEVAYCLAVSFNSKNFEANKAVILKNATAQLNFVEAVGLPAAGNTLEVKYSSEGKLNVATGVITEINSEVIRTYSNIAQIAKDGIVATDYILAPLGEKYLVDLKIKFNSEPEKLITAAPFQQSYKTNIKGEYTNMYSSTFTVSNEVEDYDNNEVGFPEKAKVGDFYYSNKTFSSTYTADPQNPCIGIVFVVNTDGKSGKIVSLDEPTQNWNGSTNVAGHLMWSTEEVNVSGATNKIDGAANTNAVMALASFSALTYPAFAWCNTKNTPAIAGIKWYLPASKELRQFYTAMCGLKWIESGIAADGEILDWNYDESMPNYSNYKAACAKFNEKFAAANGTKIDLSVNPYYWASDGENAQKAYYVTTAHGYNDNTKKNIRQRVRAISTF